VPVKESATSATDHLVLASAGKKVFAANANLLLAVVEAMWCVINATLLLADAIIVRKQEFRPKIALIINFNLIKLLDICRAVYFEPTFYLYRTSNFAAS